MLLEMFWQGGAVLRGDQASPEWKPRRRSRMPVEMEPCTLRFMTFWLRERAHVPQDRGKGRFDSPTMLTWTSKHKQVHLFGVLQSSILYNTVVTDTNLRKWNAQLRHWCRDTFEMRTFVEVLFFLGGLFLEVCSIGKWLGLFLGNVSCHIKTYESRVIAGCL